jgi:hypothetical protein
LATLNQQKPTGSPELGRSPFWERPSRALPDPEEMPASDPSRPPVGSAVNKGPSEHRRLLFTASFHAVHGLRGAPRSCTRCTGGGALGGDPWLRLLAFHEGAGTRGLPGACPDASRLGTALLGPMGVGGSGPTTPGAFPTGNSSWGRGLSRMTSNCPRCYHSMMLARTITIPRPKKFIFLCSDSDATR